MNRRRFGAGLAALAIIALPGAAVAGDENGFEGTWGGAQGELSAQVIVSGGAVIGFFWRTDYAETSNVKLSSDGRTLSFDFAGGHAVLSRVDAATATLDVAEGAKVTRLTLKRD
jgi:hypothetical protein